MWRLAEFADQLATDHGPLPEVPLQLLHFATIRRLNCSMIRELTPEMSSGSNTAKPKLACEIAADRVLVGRLAEDGRSLEACAARELAPGSVVPDLVEGNLRQRDAVK